VGFAFQLECSSCEPNDWIKEGFLNCHVGNLTITEKCEIQEPSSIDNNVTVKGVRIENKIINYIPRFNESLAQRLTYFRIHNCHLKVVLKEDLQQFTNLTLLSLASNDLEWLGGDLFVFNTKLNVLWFHNNKLKFIGENLFDSATNVWNAHFNDCFFVEFYDPDFQKLKENITINCQDEPTKLKMLEYQSKPPCEPNSS
jgi:hypothetical protein